MDKNKAVAVIISIDWENDKLVSSFYSHLVPAYDDLMTLRRDCPEFQHVLIKQDNAEE